MPYYETLIITPWIEAALDPNQDDPANHPRLLQEYPTLFQNTAKVVDWMPTATHRIVDAIGKAQLRGVLFRAAFGGLSGGHRRGYGVALPTQMYQDYIESQRAMNRPPDPWISGPHDDDDDNFALVEFNSLVTQEGVRAHANWTGQDVRFIPPVPNQYTIRCVVEESVLGAIMTNDTYFYLSGDTIPESPTDPTPPPGMYKRPPPDAMDPAVQEEYERWQERHGVNRELPRRIMALNSEITYGENSAATIAWQRELTGTATRWRIPSRQAIEDVEKRLPVLRSRRGFSRKFPAQWTPIDFKVA